MNKFYSTIFAVVVFAGLASTPFALASTTDGTIDPVNRYAWSENIGWIDFGTTLGNVHITNTELTGYAYGENVGWISLNCANDTTCGTVDYKVMNDGNGVLSGYAWNENIGWIDFAPTEGGVIIDASGNFSGSAYGENIGWITFNCAVTDSCGDVNYKVSTDWRSLSSSGPDIPTPVQEKAKITSWTAAPYSTPTTTCVQRLKLNIKGKYFSKDADVSIGGKKSSAVHKKSSRELTAAFCLDKLLQVKTDLKRTISVTNPDTDTEKADKKIDLSLYLSQPIVQSVSHRPTNTPTPTVPTTPPVVAPPTMSPPASPVESHQDTPPVVNTNPIPQTSTFQWWNPLTWW